ncbi:MAG: hypothetical protein KatS3mg087_1108 [Patescibacteria group bacterium]|nr:MAG: hypothetical protein KatS3mg087_1108 [Patescibacteria group bacterium]
MPNYFGTQPFLTNPFTGAFEDWYPSILMNEALRWPGSSAERHLWNLAYLDPSRFAGSPAIPAQAGANAAANNLGGGQVSSQQQISVKSRTGPSEDTLQSILNRVLDEYQRAYNEYRQAVEQRYQQALGLAQDQYNRIMPQVNQAIGQYIPQWYERSEQAMQMLEGLGTQALKDVERAYAEKEGALHQDLVSRGVTGSTVSPAVRTVLEREKQDAIGRVKESVRNQLVNTYLQTTGDAIKSASDLSFLGFNTDRTLTKDIIDIVANREDVPPDLGQLVQLAQLAGQGIASQEINISGVGQGPGVPVSSNLGNFNVIPGAITGWNMPFGFGAPPPVGMLPFLGAGMSGGPPFVPMVFHGPGPMEAGMMGGMPVPDSMPAEDFAVRRDLNRGLRGYLPGIIHPGGLNEKELQARDKLIDGIINEDQDKIDEALNEIGIDRLIARIDDAWAQVLFEMEFGRPPENILELRHFLNWLLQNPQHFKTLVQIVRKR